MARIPALTRESIPESQRATFDELVHQRGGVIEGIFEHEAFLKRVADIFAAIDRPYLERIAADADVDTLHDKIAARVRLRIGL